MSKKELHKTCCEETVFASLFKKHAQDLHNFLYYKYGDNLNPMDKVQDAFVKLWQNCNKIPPAKAKSYLFTVANNAMLNTVAHKKVVLKHQRQAHVKHTNIDPEFVLEEKEYHQKLERAIAQLTEAQRTAFLMNRIDGKKFGEIAKILDISIKAVEKRVYGALKKLRKDIKGL